MGKTANRHQRYGTYKIFANWGFCMGEDVVSRSMWTARSTVGMGWRYREPKQAMRRRQGPAVEIMGFEESHVARWRVTRSLVEVLILEVGFPTVEFNASQGSFINTLFVASHLFLSSYYPQKKIS